MWDCKLSEQAGSASDKTGASPNAFAIVHPGKLELTSVLFASFAALKVSARLPEVDFAHRRRPAGRPLTRRLTRRSLIFLLRKALSALAPFTRWDNVTRLRRLCDRDPWENNFSPRIQRWVKTDGLAPGRGSCCYSFAIGAPAILGSMKASNSAQKRLRNSSRSIRIS